MIEKIGKIFLIPQPEIGMFLGVNPPENMPISTNLQNEEEK